MLQFPSDSFAHNIENYSFSLDFIVCLYKVICKLTACELSVRNNTIYRKCHHAGIYNPSKSPNFSHFGVKGIGIFRLLQYCSMELWDRLAIFKVLHVTFTCTID